MCGHINTMTKLTKVAYRHVSHVSSVVLYTHTHTHARTASNTTHRREEGLHVLVGVCYRRQIHQISVQHLLVPVQVEVHRDGL